MHIAERLSPMHEEDLRWYLCEADGDMGLRSSMGNMLDNAAAGTMTSAAASGGKTRISCDKPASQLIAAERERRVRLIFNALPKCHRDILTAYYGQSLARIKLGEYRAYQELAGVVYVVASGMKKLEEARACGVKKLVGGKVGSAAVNDFDLFVMRAERELGKANRAYTSQAQAMRTATYEADEHVA